MNDMKNFIGTENGHEWVDLGLPTGTKWATCNIGATEPEEFGNYYAWGEVTPKEVYDWDTYKYGRYNQFTKYNTDSRYGRNGFADGKTVLELEDDAAHFNWGGKWRMPTSVQLEELIEECCWVWTDNYRWYVAGFIVYKAKSSNDRGREIDVEKMKLLGYSYKDVHIFIPMTGIRCRRLSFVGRGGLCWSSSIEDYSEYASFVSMERGLINGDIGFCYRYCGRSVRAVIPGE